VTFSPDQQALLKNASSLPRHVETMINKFKNNLTPDEENDPRFTFKVFLDSQVTKRLSDADFTAVLVPLGSDEAGKTNLAIKEVERRKFLPKEIVETMQAEGFSRFTMHSHTKLWQKLKAKAPGKGYGACAVGTQWSWYESWLNHVREECQKNPSLYGQP
jgi:hypothetical protein